MPATELTTLGSAAGVPAVEQLDVPRVLLAGFEDSRSGFIERLPAAGIAVLVAPPGSVLQLVAQGGTDLVLLHTDRATALAQVEQLRSLTLMPLIVALRKPRTPFDAFLEAGADDCVAFEATGAEVAVRVRTVLRRRSRSGPQEVLRSGPFSLDLGRHLFQRDGRTVHLPPKEFGLLELLLRRDGRVVTREEALAAVWGSGRGADPTTVDVHVKRLRTKVEDDRARPTRLLTVRGVGYRFQA